MKRFARLLCCGLLIVAWTATMVSAQPDPNLLDNHYKVYESEPDIPLILTQVLSIVDQWGIHQTASVTIDKFANPVEKIVSNDSFPILDPEAHQTWYQINDPEPVRQVEIENQFGRQTIHTFSGRYLVLPARKNQPGPLLDRNHYKCYAAQGSSPGDIDVGLIDQFGGMTGQVGAPLYFCNPAEKQLGANQFPIVDPDAHMTCYEILPPMMFPPISLVADDQFGSQTLTVDESLWLCVPTLKITFVGVEEQPWGNIKSLYR